MRFKATCVAALSLRPVEAFAGAHSKALGVAIGATMTVLHLVGSSYVVSEAALASLLACRAAFESSSSLEPREGCRSTDTTGANASVAGSATGSSPRSYLRLLHRHLHHSRRRLHLPQGRLHWQLPRQPHRSRLHHQLLHRQLHRQLHRSRLRPRRLHRRLLHRSRLLHRLHHQRLLHRNRLRHHVLHQRLLHRSRLRHHVLHQRLLRHSRLRHHQRLHRSRPP
ncbi:hypothetical protein MTO96_047799 [Rhipicephalus appendiculatus]